MGTTYTALKNDDGVVLCFSLVIEGYNKIITDHWDTAAMVTAYSGTDWSSVLPGLEIDGTIEQRIRPWSNAPDVPVLRFRIAPDDNDTFGTDVFTVVPAIQTRQKQSFEADTASVTVKVDSNAAFASASAFYIGRQRMALNTTSGSDGLTVSANEMGTHAPFAAGTAAANRFPRSSFLPGAYAAGEATKAVGWRTGTPQRVTTAPSVWHGKHVGLYAHRVVDGVIDVKAQAHLVFAGIIKSIGDSMAGTVLECEDLGKSILRDGMVHRQQFTCDALEGVYLNAGDWVTVREAFGGTNNDTQLDVVSSGATAPYEINAGYYTADEIVDAFNAWMAKAEDDGEISANALWSIVETEIGWRGQFSTRFTTTQTGRQTWVKTNNEDILQTLGYDYKAGGRLTLTNQKLDTTEDLVSDGPPWKVRPWGQKDRLGIWRRIQIEPTGGYLIDQTAFFPEELKNAGLQNGGYWAVMETVSGERLLCQFASGYGDTPGHIVGYTRVDYFSGLGGKELDPFDGITYGSDASYQLKQVLVMAGTFTDIVARLFLGMDGQGINDSTYDDLGPGVGVGFPQSLLSTAFVNSLAAISEATENNAIALIVDAPTRLIDIIAPELALRMAWFVFKDGGYFFVAPPVPNPLTADHTLTENNKAGVSGDIDDLRTETIMDTESMRNIIKIHYNQDNNGTYIENPSIESEPSISDYGPLPVTIKAANSYLDKHLTGATVEELAANLAARALPVYGRPLRKYVRTVDFNTIVQMAPGDTATLTDNFARNPTTGARGVTARACTVLATRIDFGHTTGNFLGECELLYTEEERIFPLGVAGEIDETFTSGTFTAGYSTSGGYFIKLKDNACSPAADSDDVISFSAGDIVDVVEIDPASAASPQEWTGLEVLSTTPGSDYLKLDAALTGHSSSKIYRVRPTAYTGATASQRLKAYQCDTSTRLIDSGSTNDPAIQMGDRSRGDISTTKDATRLGGIITTTWGGDTEPVDAGVCRDLVDTANALVSYRQNINQPIMVHAGVGAVSGQGYTVFTAGDWKAYWVFPLSNLGGPPSPGLKRQLNIAPGMESTAAGTIDVRVSLARSSPNGSGVVDWTFRGSLSQNTWSMTGVTAAAVGTLWTVDVPVYNEIVVLVELRRDGTGDGYFYGLSKFYLGPLTAA